ncbi:nucleoside-diphosphate sugar epimerase/dehydratase [Magnetospira sp. QH-2]|uniref:polysaccharide biosynthesis protein n=1 Tax=Magnetospira sp. (strain QH-2) TaxID=1288970 RepID=UPI0003E80FD2|nr:nucleoside-diphosphate sugar epimerase/dehydratase [Magnetospira sp. QH-2]CCQ75452.1 putative polysaccharide biosynthesis protein CapD-like protein [Magnetospira sp. QH-2]
MAKLARLRRGSVVFLHDVFMAALSFGLTIYLRTGEEFHEIWRHGHGGEAMLMFAVICGAVFWAMNLYRGIWRYASLNDMTAIAKSVTLAILIFTAVMFIWTRLELIPRSLPLLNWFVLIALLGGPRFLYRLIKDRRIDLTEDGNRPAVPVLLVGAGDGAELFLRALRNGGMGYRVTGILSETSGRVGRLIRDVRVVGTLEDLETVIGDEDDEDRPQKLIVTKDTMDGARLRALLDRADGLGLTLARLPKLTDLKSGLAEGMDVRPIDVADLLGRPQATLDRDAMHGLVAGKTVVVTGAGGSIGSELVRQVSDLGPSHLVLVENSEFALYRIDQEMAQRHPGIDRKAVIADVRDRDRLNRLFSEIGPQVVFHAAALKHVPLVEANLLEGVRTNILGTRNVADACVAHGVECMVMISTDKAVNPSSIMGLTKRVAEIYCQALDIDRAGQTPNFVTVRFGNVLGSTGSVVPLFQKQLQAGGPLTVTHPDMKRYFMTIREAVELVLEASALAGRNHDEGKIFVLDMGEPVRIVDLARQMIRLAGLRPDEDVEIHFTGIRPGEKLFEEIFHGAEDLVPTKYKGILLAAPRLADRARMEQVLGEMESLCTADEADRVLTLARELVPEYQTEA